MAERSPLFLEDESPDLVLVRNYSDTEEAEIDAAVRRHPASFLVGVRVDAVD